MKTAKILHVDGDSFFASCEMSLDYRLRGLPVVTGGERGIASSMSKEAKALGIYRGMPIFKIRKLYPQVVVRSSDYLNYTIFAERMYAIVRRYSDVVEEYSIDECFAELASGEQVEEIKGVLQRELGMTFSLGLAPTKVLAKLVSSQNKPDGLATLVPEDTSRFLREIDVGKVWGIGPATAQELRTLGIETALDLSNKIPEWTREHLHKSTLAIWYELRGESRLAVHGTVPSLQQSVQSTKTFSPPSKDKRVILSELSKNIENAFVNIRRVGQCANKMYYFLKTQEYRYHRLQVDFEKGIDTPEIAINRVKDTLNQVQHPNTLYRATGVTLAGLVPKEMVQSDLFDSSCGNEAAWQKVFKVVDTMDKRYGSHTLVLGSSLVAFQRQGGASIRRLRIPYIGEVL